MLSQRQLRLTYDDLDDLALRVHPDNPKRHDLIALDASVERFGFAEPVLINDSDDRLLAGHGRVELLLLQRARGAPPPPGIHVDESGHWLLPVIHGMELTEDDARAYLVTANRVGELGGWDETRLAALLEQLAGSASGLDAVGFSLADLEHLVAGLGKKTEPAADPDEAPASPGQDQLYVARGQTWRLGRHRLRCGDATVTADVEGLLQGQRAAIAVTDPPYNVNYGRHGGAGQGNRRTIANDSLQPAEWESFVQAWSKLLFAHVDGAAYVFMSSLEWPLVCRLLAEAGGHWSDTIIWMKDQFTLGRADYQRQYEPIWYGWRTGTKHHWCGDRDQGDVWQFPKPSASELHPTMKPVGLIERAIANSSSAGAIVLDLFAGSGTTIIAAERQGRTCYALELEPAFVQVALERWKQYTGRAPELEEG